MEDKEESERVKSKLSDQSNIEIFVCPNDDYWMRDSGPIFIADPTGILSVCWFGYNGWGNKFPYCQNAFIPKFVADSLSFPIVDCRQKLVLEGGSIESDGNRTLFICESSILNSNRNKGVNKKQASQIL